MKVILLQRVAKLGTIGDVVHVKPGFARNYLLPRKIALRATNENKKIFEEKRSQIEAANADSRAEAQKIADGIQGLCITMVRQASEKGHLYGSVTAREIAIVLKARGLQSVAAGNINLQAPIKELGVYDLSVDLHPEVAIQVKLSIAKTEEEALGQMAVASSVA
ncbi:MAG: 50S ribosomal protein L9 [Holosporaceae bacterium]|nr:50S ribosomal protein L9 [Holosporaceae bacterium]